jgi:hypothetical protein
MHTAHLFLLHAHAHARRRAHRCVLRNPAERSPTTRSSVNQIQDGTIRQGD